MFLDFYKLREQPFSETPDPRYVYLSLTHREALASLFYGIETGRGFLALIAEPGMGKTTLLFHLLQLLRESARTAFLFQTQCDSRELLRYLLADLEIDTREKDLVWMHERLKKVLIVEARAGKHFVVFIDEAQNLSDSALETVRLLSNFETARSKLMQIVLAGQPRLADKLARPELRQLCQRISILSRLGPFTRAETSVYIDHRLKTAGYKGGHLFTPEARAMIAAWSDGVPRKINNLCFSALTLGYALGQKEIDSSVVREAANDLEVGPLVSNLYDSDQPLQPVATISPSALLHAHGASGKRDVGASPGSTPASRSASTPVSVPAAFGTCSRAPAVSAATNAFGGSSFPRELIAPAAAEATPQSTVPPTTVTRWPVPPTAVRTKAEPLEPGTIQAPGDRRACGRQLLDTAVSPVHALRENLPPPSVPDLLASRLKQASRAMLLAGAVVVVLFVVGAAGAFFLHRGIAQPFATTKINPGPVASPVSTAPNKVQRVRSASSRAPVAPREPPAAWAGEIPNGKVLASLAAAPRSAATIDREAPPDLTGVASDAPADAIQGVLAASSNILPAPSLTPEETAPVHVGGRVEEPQLIFKVLPNYPLAAKQIGLEGKVVIDAVIDATGKVTNMKVVAGPLLLQRAALDSVSKWKYEPSFLDDMPVPVEMLITVEFRLH